MKLLRTRPYSRSPRPPGHPVSMLKRNPGEPDHPRRSLRTKAMIAVTALVTIPTMLCGYLTHRRAAEAMDAALMRDSVVLGQTVSHVVESYLDRGRPADLRRALGMIMKDQRIAFIVVTGMDNRILAHRYNEPLAWNAYQRQLTPQERTTPLTLNRSIELRDETDAAVLVVRRQLIQSDPTRPLPIAAATVSTSEQPTRSPGGPDVRPDRVDEPRAPGRPGRIVGYLEMGMHDPHQAQVLADLRDATILVVGVIILVCMPLVIWFVNNWTAPLRRMLEATVDIGLGRRFDRVDIERDDELGVLARAFNDMAENLYAIQHALIESNEQLEDKVAHRTVQLEQAKVRLEQEMVEKDQFIRAISHDLGAPLRNIAGLTTMLMLKHKADMEQEALSKLERISANVKAETELLNDLLNLSRIKTRQGRRQQVDLNELVQSIIGSLGFDLEQQRIELIFDTPLPVMNVERNRMRQVFQNLIDNAIKYMPADAERREIHVGFTHRGSNDVFYVRDTGKGVASKDQHTIFQVFRRARYSGGARPAGRGVGLATVKTIVELNGGRIWVDSDPPRGATFYFTVDSRYLRQPSAAASDQAGGAPSGDAPPAPQEVSPT